MGSWNYLTVLLLVCVMVIGLYSDLGQGLSEDAENCFSSTLATKDRNEGKDNNEAEVDGKTKTSGKNLESEENGIYMEDVYEEEENGKFQFSLELFKDLYDETSQAEDANLFFSPHSIHQALLLSLFGAKAETEKQIRSTLHLNETQGKSDLYRRFIASNRNLYNSSVNGVDFNIANRIYFSEDEPIRMCIKNVFGGQQIQQINFNEAEEATKMINKWVEAETKSKIKDLIPPGDLSPSSRIALVNSAYFKGEWQQKFDQSATKLSLFHISPDNITQTMMMYLKGNFRHGASESLKSYILDMPYKGNSHSMIILLPPFLPGALNETMSRLTSETLVQSIDDLRNNKNSEFSFNDEVEIYMPKFKIEQSFELTKALNRLGVKDLFNPDLADLTDFSEKSGLSFNKALHKSFLEVNEEGSEAAAATSFISARRGRLHPLTHYIINRPFIFFIIDNTNRNDILFMGVFKSPKTTMKKNVVST